VERQPGRAVHVVAAISALAGPAGAWRYESGGLRLFAGDLVVDLWLLVVIASAGAVVGAVCIFKGARVLGVLCALGNLAVALLYGFIALFFSLGGSR